MKLALRILLALSTIATTTMAQVITPVWVQRIVGPGPENTTLINVNAADKLPILAGGRIEPNNNEDGTETQPEFVRLQRYDANRLLLFVPENGINETDPALTPEQIALAAAYPDKSIIWIDAATGKSLGVAFHEVDHPAQLIGIDVRDPATGNQLPAYDPVINFYWRPSLDEGAPGQRALYSGINHLILRYAPLANGSGWTNIPTVAYAESVPGYGDGLTDASGGTSGDNAQRWRWRNFRVFGSGTNTTIVGGGGTWRPGMHTQVLVTTNGLTFYPRGRVDDRSGGIRNNYSGGGTGSRVVKYGSDPAHPNLEVYYQGHYPAYAYNSETPERYVSDPDRMWLGNQDVVDYNQQLSVAMFESTSGTSNTLSGVTNNLPPFTWEEAGKDGLPVDNNVDGVSRYAGQWSVNCEANSSLDYIVSYSCPSWNNAMPVPTHGWIGVHRLDGSVAGGEGSSYELPVTELDVPTPYAANVGNEYLYNAWVEVNPDTTAPANLKKAEILGAFGPVGFGLFTVQNVAAGVTTQPLDVSVLAGTTNSFTAVISGSPNFYRWKKDGVALNDGRFLSGSKRATLTLRDVVKADAGSYQLEITNPLSGTTTTRAAKLTVVGAYVRPHQNAAIFGVASQIDTYPGYPAANAIDGNTNGNSFAHTADGHTNATPTIWWEVDLLSTTQIGRIVYFPRNDCCSTRQTEVNVVILNASHAEVDRYVIGGAGNGLEAYPDATTVDYTPTKFGRYVRIERTPIVQDPPVNDYLNIAEVQVFNVFRPTMDIGVYNGQIMVAWDSDAFSTPKLQKASSLAGPWTDVTTVTPFTGAIGGTTFYKLVTGP